MMARMRIREFVESDTEPVVALWHAAELVRSWNDPHRDITRKLAVQRDLFLVDALEFYAALGYSVDAAVSLGKRLIPDT